MTAGLSGSLSKKEYYQKLKEHWERERGCLFCHFSSRSGDPQTRLMGHETYARVYAPFMGETPVGGKCYDIVTGRVTAETAEASVEQEENVPEQAETNLPEQPTLTVPASNSDLLPEASDFWGGKGVEMGPESQPEGQAPVAEKDAWGSAGSVGEIADDKKRTMPNSQRKSNVTAGARARLEAEYKSLISAIASALPAEALVVLRGPGARIAKSRKEGQWMSALFKNIVDKVRETNKTSKVNQTPVPLSDASDEWIVIYDAVITILKRNLGFEKIVLKNLNERDRRDLPYILKTALEDREALKNEIGGLSHLI